MPQRAVGYEDEVEGVLGDREAAIGLPENGAKAVIRTAHSAGENVAHRQLDRGQRRQHPARHVERPIPAVAKHRQSRRVVRGQGPQIEIPVAVEVTPLQSRSDRTAFHGCGHEGRR